MRRRSKEMIKSTVDSWWSIAVIAALTSVVLYQHWQTTHPHRREFARAGELVKAVNLRTQQDQAVPIDWKSSAKGTIVYVMSPDCVWCQRNSEAANAAYLQAAHSGYRFISISLNATGLSDYVLRNNVPFPIYLDKDRSASKALKLGVTPETIVVSPAGLVQKVVLGAYRGKNADVMGALLEMKLPQVPNA